MFGKKIRLSKKGFTLIELLAVIVILGLLLGIVFPAISNYINGARQSTYEFHEADLETAAKNKMTECVKSGEEDCAPAEGRSKKITLQNLVDEKYSERLKDPQEPDEFCDTERSYVLVKNTTGNLSKLEYEVCLVCGDYESRICKEMTNDQTNCDRENDTKKPTCGKATGESVVWTNEDRIISVSCSDEDCGCTQDKYTKKFTESAKTGTITIKDQSVTGNETDCPVNVYIDKEKPECTLEIEGALGEDNWYGGSLVKVKLKTRTDALSGVNTYGMGTSSKNYDFNKSTEYIVKPGITTVYGYVKDNAGNVGTCSVEVKYDDVKPTITYVRYGYQVYKKEDIATVKGNVISLEDITGEYGTIYGAMIYLNSTHKGGDVRIKNGDNELVKRTISAGVQKMEFKFDKEGTYNNLKIDIGTLKVEDIERIELLTGESETNKYFTNKNVTAYITAHDSLSGISKYSFDEGKTWQNENSMTYQNNTSFTVAVKDVAANVSDKQVKKITNIDKLEPKCTITLPAVNGKNGWYTSDVKLTLNRSDSAANSLYASSGVRRYGLVQNSDSVTYNGVSTDTQKEDTKSVKWYGYVIDKAGNTNECSVEVKKDETDPQCTTYGGGYWVNYAVTLTGKCSDSTSGCATEEVTADFYQEMNSWESPGVVMDNAGNTGICPTSQVMIDITPPSCTLNVVGWYNMYNGWYLGGHPVTNGPNYSLYYFDVKLVVNSFDSNFFGISSGVQSSYVTDVYLMPLSPFPFISLPETSYYNYSNVYFGMVTDYAGNQGICGPVFPNVEKCENVATSPIPVLQYCDCMTTCSYTYYLKYGISGMTCGYNIDTECDMCECVDDTPPSVPSIPSVDIYEGNDGSGNNTSEPPVTPNPDLGGNQTQPNLPQMSCEQFENTAFGSYKGNIDGNTGNYYPKGSLNYKCKNMCQVTSGYDRICANKSVCGDWYGQTAAYIKSQPGYSCVSKYWCTCDGSF